MSVNRRPDGVWFYRKRIRLFNGVRIDITGTPSVNNKVAALAMEAEHAVATQSLGYDPKKKEKKQGITFDEFWNGAYWREAVIGKNLKTATINEKKRAYNTTIKPIFGDMPLMDIDTSSIAQFRANLLSLNLTVATINQYISYIGTALTYALECKLIENRPNIKYLKSSGKEIEPFDFDQYKAIVKAASENKANWYIGVLLAGECGLRIGEIRALLFSDIDFKGRTISINKQIRRGATGSPKGGRSRVVPMTDFLFDALNNTLNKSGYVCGNYDGSQHTDGEAAGSIVRIFKKAGGFSGSWHRLRHTFATHSAYFSINAWSLQAWLGHMDQAETMGYVQYTQNHSREIPQHIINAGINETNSDKKVLLMLGARNHQDSKVSSVKVH